MRIALIITSRRMGNSVNPELKQFGDLRPEDFDRCAVWASCHSFDCDELWYDETDEETLRPWDGQLPVDPSDGMFLVKAKFRLSDGREFWGYVTPGNPEEDASIGILQPYLAVGSQFFGFWGGMLGVAKTAKDSFYAAIAADHTTAFPIEFSVDTKFALRAISGTIAGFYRLPQLGSEPVVER